MLGSKDDSSNTTGNLIKSNANCVREERTSLFTFANHFVSLIPQAFCHCHEQNARNNTHTIYMAAIKIIFNLIVDIHMYIYPRI